MQHELTNLYRSAGGFPETEAPVSVRHVLRSVWQNPGNRGGRLRRSWRALGWQVWKHSIRRPLTLRLANGVTFRAYPDCVISSGLVYADWPEYAELQFIRSRLKPGQLVIDVGANVGHVSLLTADRVGPENLVAFEPAPAAYARLVENWTLNRWRTDKLFQEAVGARSGRAYIRNVTAPLPTNTLSDIRYTKDCVEVNVVALDDVPALWQHKSVGLLKIDVEGGELGVFRGGQALLGEARPSLIMFESLSGKLDPAIGELLRSLDYVLFQLDDEGQPQCMRLHGQNLLAVPAGERPG